MINEQTRSTTLDYSSRQPDCVSYWLVLRRVVGTIALLAVIGACSTDDAASEPTGVGDLGLDNEASSLDWDCASRDQLATGGGTGDLDWSFFVMLGGQEYHRRAEIDTRFLGEPLGTTCIDLADSSATADYQVRNGDAAFIPAGSEVRTIQGADPALRVAVAHAGGSTYSYETLIRSDARAGGEVVDLNNTATIDVLAAGSERQLATISDPDAVASLTRMVQEAPLDASARSNSGGENLRIRFVRDDMTFVSLNLRVVAGDLARFIVVPQAFVESVLDAVHAPT